jgi:hypothetical protein
MLVLLYVAFNIPGLSENAAPFVEKAGERRRCVYEIKQEMNPSLGFKVYGIAQNWTSRCI